MGGNEPNTNLTQPGDHHPKPAHGTVFSVDAGRQPAIAWQLEFGQRPAISWGWPPMPG